VTLPGAAALADFAPMAERAVSADQDCLIRLRGASGTIAGFVRLPYDVLAGRTLSAADLPAQGGLDATFDCVRFLGWLDGSTPLPPRRDAAWLSPLPPRDGWQRVEVVPDSAIREVVRSGALLAADASSRASQQSLLDSVVLTATSGTRRVDVPLGPLSALTRMGFLPRGGEAAVDVAPGWIRIAAGYGSTFVADGNPLGLLSL
jgi:hypothetical protein